MVSNTRHWTDNLEEMTGVVDGMQSRRAGRRTHIDYSRYISSVENELGIPQSKERRALFRKNLGNYLSTPSPYKKTLGGAIVGIGVGAILGGFGGAILGGFGGAYAGTYGARETIKDLWNGSTGIVGTVYGAGKTVCGDISAFRRGRSRPSVATAVNSRGASGEDTNSIDNLPNEVTFDDIAMPNDDIVNYGIAAPGIEKMVESNENLYSGESVCAPEICSPEELAYSSAPLI